MKKTLALILAVMMILSLAACGTNNTAPAGNNSQNAANNTENQNSLPENTVPSNTAPADTPDNTGENTETAKKVLIVYFTPANSDTADAVSSATPRVGNVSSTEYVAQLINAKVDADVARIVPTEAYPLAYNASTDKAKQEQNDNVRPEFTLDVDPEGYDVIFFGYPIWWYHLPMIARTFFEKYDFSGKTIIPYVTHGGSRDGGTFNEIKELEPNATVLEGLAISGQRASNSESDVNKWLAGLGY